MSWVMDCSIAGALALPDERSQDAERFLTVFAGDERVWVPPLWWYEMSNLLVAAMRRRRLTEAGAACLAELYCSLPLLTDAPPSPAIASSVRRIAIAHSLSAYDAAYLELAQRLASVLATLNQDLARAATKSGVPLFVAETPR